ERKVEERERVPGEDGREHLPQRDDEGHDEAVLQVGAHVPGVPRVRVAVPLGVDGEELWWLPRDVDRREQRGYDRDVDREDDDRRQHGQQRVPADLPPPATAVQRTGVDLNAHTTPSARAAGSAGGRGSA